MQRWHAAQGQSRPGSQPHLRLQQVREEKEVRDRAHAGLISKAGPSFRCTCFRRSATSHGFQGLLHSQAHARAPSDDVVERALISVKSSSASESICASACWTSSRHSLTERYFPLARREATFVRISCDGWHEL